MEMYIPSPGSLLQTLSWWRLLLHIDIHVKGVHPIGVLEWNAGPDSKYWDL